MFPMYIYIHILGRFTKYDVHTLIFYIVPYIFGTMGLQKLPDILATGSSRFQIYRELEDQGIEMIKPSSHAS